VLFGTPSLSAGFIVLVFVGFASYFFRASPF
jgi:hypothetical protein